MSATRHSILSITLRYLSVQPGSLVHATDDSQADGLQWFSRDPPPAALTLLEWWSMGT